MAVKDVTDNGYYVAIGLIGANLLAGTAIGPLAAGFLGIVLLFQITQLAEQGKGANPASTSAATSPGTSNNTTTV